MVDSQSLDLAFADEPHEQAVGVLEHLRVLHAYRRQLGDVEEPPVVDLLSGNAPEGKPVRLGIEQRVQAVEAGRVALFAVHLLYHCIESGAELGGRRVERVDAPLDDFLLAVALLERGRVEHAAWRQVAYGGEDAG